MQVRQQAAAAAPWLAMGAAVAPLLSIAAANVLLGAAVACLVVSGQRWHLPPFWRPIALFVAITLVSLVASGDVAAGLPQVKKFWVYLLPVVLYSVVTEVRQYRWILLGWVAAGALGAAWSITQYVRKYLAASAAGRNFYEAYVADRTTGTMSHWMTFGGEQMLVLCAAGALLLLGGKAAWMTAQKLPGPRALLAAAIALLGVAVLLNQTRSVWLALGAAALYLIGVWNWRLLPAVPVLLVGALLVAPADVRRRAESLVKPDARLDSNRFREVTFQTGLRMIAAHPVWGLGPEQVGKQFDQYKPAHLDKPLGYYNHLHNLYVHYAAERGVGATLALVWLMLGAVWMAVGALRRDGMPDEARSILQAMVAGLLAIAVEGCFELNLGDSEILMLTLVLLCAGYRAAEGDEARTPKPLGSL